MLRHLAVAVCTLVLTCGLAVSVSADDSIPSLVAMQDLVKDAMHGPVEEGDAAGVAALYPKMEEVSQTLQHVTLPEGMADVQKDFDKARQGLGKAVNTLGKAIEEVTQDVISVEADDEEKFRKAIMALYEKYRSPRTPYSLWGSNQDGQRIAKALIEETGGGWL